MKTLNKKHYGDIQQAHQSIHLPNSSKIGLWLNCIRISVRPYPSSTEPDSKLLPQTSPSSFPNNFHPQPTLPFRYPTPFLSKKNPYGQLCRTLNIKAPSLTPLQTSLFRIPRIPLLFSLSQPAPSQTIRPHFILQYLHPMTPSWRRRPTRIDWTFSQSNLRTANTKTLRAEFDTLLSRYSQYASCFVDGSKSSAGDTNGAYMIDTHLSSFAVSKILNINSIEMAAINQCLINLPTASYTLNSLYSRTQKFFYSDSKFEYRCALTSQTLFLLDQLTQSDIEGRTHLDTRPLRYYRSRSSRCSC
jgi:hypothetical protein